MLQRQKYLLDNYKIIDFLFCYVLYRYTCILNSMTATAVKKIGRGTCLLCYCMSPLEQRQWSGTLSCSLMIPVCSLYCRIILFIIHGCPWKNLHNWMTACIVPQSVLLLMVLSQMFKLHAVATLTTTEFLVLCSCARSGWFFSFKAWRKVNYFHKPYQIWTC